LSEDERARILAVLGSPEFADKSPGQVYTILLDRGVYLCSEASMYRLLRERGQSGDRRAQATHPAKKKPELMADVVRAAREAAGRQGDAPVVLLSGFSFIRDAPGVADFLSKPINFEKLRACLGRFCGSRLAGPEKEEAGR
jgi:alkanesulfonate monooxygenase SsuD/methylene tetrahydromethanopterin reductase-like flavin-dependent oxidoreductase (luciferase family)